MEGRNWGRRGVGGEWWGSGTDVQRDRREGQENDRKSLDDGAKGYGASPRPTRDLEWRRLQGIKESDLN